MIAIALSGLPGCGDHYTPAAPLDLADAPAWQAKEPVALINGQPATEEVLIRRRAGAEAFANYRAWTDTAVQIAQQGLVRRGVTVAPGSAKTLTLAITDVRSQTDAVESHTTITLRVTASDGRQKTYTGSGSAPAKALFHWHLDNVMAWTVHLMLDDPALAEFLSH